MRDFRTVAGIIKQSVSALTVGTDLGLEPGRDGKCKCIFHNDRNPSMKLYGGDKGFYCFSCHVSGDVIDLAVQAMNSSKWYAVQYLNEFYHLNIPLQSVDPASIRQAERQVRKKRRETADTKTHLAELERRRNETLERLLKAEDEVSRMAPEMPPGGPEDVVFSDEFATMLFVRDVIQGEAEEAQGELEYAYWIDHRIESKGGDTP